MSVKKANYLIGIDEVGRAAKHRRASPSSYLVGIDEVGRGPLAGPVTVAALALPAGFRFQMLGVSKKLKDSKKLSAKQREEWYKIVTDCSELKPKTQHLEPRLFFATASVYPKVIDRINISQAANLAATRALKKLLVTSDWRLVNKKIHIFLDGGLFINKKLLVTSRYPLVAKTVVRGDEKFNCVKLASIVAKVKRDRLMKRLHKKFPIYGFDEHMGYGTKKHIAAIKKHGISEAHRISFVQNFV